MLEKNLNYLEGLWVGSQVAKNIEKTTYGTLEQAIQIKEELISNFEKEFGYSRMDKEFTDTNYTYNLGMLDKFKELNQLKK